LGIQGHEKASEIRGLFLFWLSSGTHIDTLKSKMFGGIHDGIPSKD
jgi:hypothetical protein